MMQNPDAERISYVQAKYIDELMNKPHVIGVAVGMKQTDGETTKIPALVVMVDEKVPLDTLAEDERIPSELEGVPVDVQAMGTFTTFNTGE